MSIRPEEISTILKKQIEEYKSEVEVSNVGTVLQVADGVARVHGVSQAMSGEMIEFPGGIFGMALT